VDQEANRGPLTPQELRFHLLLAAGAALAALLGVLVGMRLYFAPRAQKAFIQVETARDVLALALLEERHHRWAGDYTNDFRTLARISGDPKGFVDTLGRHLDLDTVLVSATSTHYVIEANALDSDRTLVHYEGPMTPDVP